jgi:hypothetical protein
MSMDFAFYAGLMLGVIVGAGAANLYRSGQTRFFSGPRWVALPLNSAASVTLAGAMTLGMLTAATVVLGAIFLIGSLILALL